MTRYILNQDGSISSSIIGSKSLVELNTPADAEYVDTDKFTTLSDYWNGSEFISIGEAPTPHDTFDYSAKQWVDLRSLDEIKAQKWVEIKQQRDQLEFGGFEFDGGVYDSDQVSQGRIMGVTAAGADQVWTLANNTTVNLTAAQLQQLYAALQAHIASVHGKGRIARQLIYEAETKEEVEAIQL